MVLYTKYSNHHYLLKYTIIVGAVQVHGDYSEDVGVKMERPAEETVVEGENEVVGA